jgi:hypothetical protein
VHLLTDHVIETQPDVDRKQNAVRGDGPENYFYFAVTPRSNPRTRVSARRWRSMHGRWGLIFWVGS